MTYKVLIISTKHLTEFLFVYVSAIENDKKLELKPTVFKYTNRHLKSLHNHCQTQ